MPVHDKVPVLPWKEFQDTSWGRRCLTACTGAGRFIARSDTGMAMITGKASAASSCSTSTPTNRAGGSHPLAERRGGGAQLRLRSGNMGADYRQRRQQLFFKCPDLWMISYASTDLNIDLRGQGGYTVVPPSKGYGWLPAGHRGR